MKNEMSAKRELEEPAMMQVCRRIRLASPSPKHRDTSDTESIHSCQGYETELVKDTSDTSSSPTQNDEYELSYSRKARKFYYMTDSDDDGVFDEQLVNRTLFDSSDTALLGDTSEENSTSPTSNSDVDPGLPRNDYLDFERCSLCRTDQKNISYPYCSACFSWKKSIFPSRPKKHRKVAVNSVPKASLKTDQNLGTDMSSSDCENNAENKRSASSEGYLEDSGLGNSNPQSSEDVVDGPSQPRLEEEEQLPLNQEPSTSGLSDNSQVTFRICRICYQKPENGLFLHKDKVHMYGCYSCANKIWSKSGCCPICRGKIYKVSRLFS